MTVVLELLLPACMALLLCAHLGYALARLTLPDQLRPYHLLLTPLAGCGLLLNSIAALTTTTVLTPPAIAAGLAVLALPFNLWAWRRGRRPGAASLDKSEWPFVALCAGLAGLVFVLAILPPLRWGASLPIGSNWDAAEFYVPLGRALQLRSQHDFALLGSSPLTAIFTSAPMSGRIHAFSYLHAVASSASGVEPLRSYASIMALLLAFQPLAVYPLGRSLGLPRAASLLAATLVALAWLPLWVTYNSFSNHVLSLPLLPIALASSIVALRVGGWRAIASAALFTSALATGYYPALTAYIALFGPAAFYLLWSLPTRRAAVSQAGKSTRKYVAGNTSAGRALSSSELQTRLKVLARGLALGGLAFVLSGAAQGYFFLRAGFLQDMSRNGGGFQISEFVGLADALGLSATFNRESFVFDPRLVLLGSAFAVALALVALLARPARLLLALAAGAAAYQAGTAAKVYHYGFYKGITFEIPILALLIAAGASYVWQAKWRWPHGRALARSLLVAGLALLVGLNSATSWATEQRYSAAGPQLWSIAEADLVELRAHVPPAASVLVVPPDRHPEVFNSLISYSLLGHDLFGRFKTGYNSLDVVESDRPADLALLPDDADPGNYGYRSDEVRWAGDDLRLYSRAPGVRYHREFGDGGRYPALTSATPLALRLRPGRIALPNEAEPPAAAPAEARLTLAVASFAPATIELTSAQGSQRFRLPGGLVQITSAAVQLPGEIGLRSIEGDPVYLWWGELCDPVTCAAGVTASDDVFLQLAPATGVPPTHAAIELQLHSQRLPAGAQQLTAVATVAYAPANSKAWKEIGQWIFFPGAEQRQRLDLDLANLHASLSSAGKLIEIAGAVQPAGDGQYQVTLLFANNARIVYGTHLLSWQLNAGRTTDLALDTVTFDVVPLPRPATARLASSLDGAIQLRGYTSARARARSGDTLHVSVVWQALRKINSDLRAELVLCDATGRELVAQALPIGAREHGTSSWLPGEIAEQPFALELPRDAAPGLATLSLELLGADAQALPFAEAPGALPLLEISIGR